MRNLIWYIFAGTRGGEMRAKVIYALIKKPRNANQLSKELNVDYKTIQHHIKVLYENSLINAINKDKYGATYFISDLMERNINLLKEIWKGFGKKYLNDKEV